MKILLLCEFFNEDLEFQENLLVKYYVSKGHNVVVVTSLFDSVFDYYEDRAPKGSRREYFHGGAKIIKLPFRFNLLNRIRPLRLVKNILSEEKPDLIYVHSITPNLTECVSYVRTNPETRMIMDYHGDYSNSGKNWLSTKILHGLIRKWYLDRARPYLHKIFPITPTSFEFLREVYRVPADEMELLLLGTDLEYGNLIRTSGGGAEVRRSLGIDPAHFVIITGGKLSSVRRIEHLLTAVAAIKRDDLHVIVAGTAAPKHKPYEAMLKELAAGNPQVHFVGWLGKRAMYQHMDAANIAVFPGGQSVLWQQSIGMGLPLIVGDRSEQIRGFQDARYLNRHDNVVILNPRKPTADQIETWIKALIDDSEELRRRSEGARRTAQEMLDYNILVEQTLRFNTSAPRSRT